MADTPNAETLATIAALVAAAGAAALLFRVERELAMEKKGEQVWIAGADWLIIGAVLVAIFGALLPLLIFHDPDLCGSNLCGRRIPTAACTASLAALAGYPFGILAHYRLLFGKDRDAARLDREQTEPAEFWIIFISATAAVFFAGASLIATA